MYHFFPTEPSPWCRDAVLVASERRICPAFCSSSVMWASFGTWPCKAFSKACAKLACGLRSLQGVPDVSKCMLGLLFWQILGRRKIMWVWMKSYESIFFGNKHPWIPTILMWKPRDSMWVLTHHHVLNAWRLAPPLYKDALGDLQRLYLPRDFRGAFCGVSTGRGWQWWMWWFIMMWWAY